ncbi:type VI secretion system baseplate subunit TssG [Aromatoleum petrolei]|uniref:Type VI secretion system baseplate subunit TssG n=1 Tax=Aromatoleum petrolei TaxID=76116 RepID=A0ABX1MIX5_9RHOO|nr:type VI secretion system baseplate subunit TssG [Aromatoleum petrolei]NMF87893.1 type VI secretion system baseplate subunit TssG [Aromatoleum petrolei]QTQ35238.1 Putative type VI secretion system protein, ImpH [Aromatoleum petrolei]
MRAALGRFDPGVIEQLVEAPYRFEFFQAVRLLDGLFRGEDSGRRHGADVLSERIRFRNTLHQGFAPAEIEALDAWPDDGDGNDGPRRWRTVEITPYAIGLLGVHGALPAHYTERISERERIHRDRAARALLDIFANRAVAQFYLAWKKYRLPLQYESDRRNRFLPLVLAVAGLGFDALRERMRDGPGRIEDEAIARVATLLSQRPLSARALERILSGHFRVPVRVEQFVGAWYALPDDQRTTLGGCNALLGRTALSGERVWQRNLRVKIHVGPLAGADYYAFLPGGESAAALAKLLQLATGHQFEYEVRPCLRAADVRPAALGAAMTPRLGCDAFLASRLSSRDRDDAVYSPGALH